MSTFGLLPTYTCGLVLGYLEGQCVTTRRGVMGCQNVLHFTSITQNGHLMPKILRNQDTSPKWQDFLFTILFLSVAMSVALQTEEHPLEIQYGTKFIRRFLWRVSENISNSAHISIFCIMGVSTQKYLFPLDIHFEEKGWHVYVCGRFRRDVLYLGT